MKTNQDFVTEFNKAVEAFSRNKLKEALKLATAEQLEMFNRMYKSIEVIPSRNMAWAYSQVMRSVTKNYACPVCKDSGCHACDPESIFE